MMLQDKVSEAIARQQTVCNAKHAGEGGASPLPATLFQPPEGADDYQPHASPDLRAYAHNVA